MGPPLQRANLAMAESKGKESFLALKKMPLNFNITGLKRLQIKTKF